MKTGLFKSGIALAVVAGCLVPLSAGAQVVQEVVAGQQQQAVAASAGVVPSVVTDAGDHLFLRVINPSGDPVTFSVPDLGISYGIPPFSEKTFFVDTSTIMASQVPYRLQSSTGTPLASGVIINEDYLFPAEGVALARLINYETAYSVPIDPEPQYRERPAALPVQPQKRYMIRGFW